MRRRFKQTQDETPKEKILDVDASMQGTLSFNDPVNLRINGKFEGKLNTKGILMVGEHADIAADIVGEHITVAGKVSGNIKARKELKVISPARIVGDIETPVLSVSEGWNARFVRHQPSACSGPVSPWTREKNGP